MAHDENFNMIDQMEIEPLSDEALETVAGGKSSDGPQCCSCECCSNGKTATEIGQIEVGTCE